MKIILTLVMLFITVNKEQNENRIYNKHQVAFPAGRAKGEQDEDTEDHEPEQARFHCGLRVRTLRGY